MKKIFTCILILALLAAVFSACGEDKLKDAKDYLNSMYKVEEEVQVTPSDFTRVNSLFIKDVSYTVEWSVNIKSGPADSVAVVPVDGGNTVKIDVNEKSAEDVLYELVATIKPPKGKSGSLTFNCKVPMFKELTWNEYVAAATGDTVVVKGVVTGIMAKSLGNSYNCLYLQDDVGGYYVYNMADDPAEGGIVAGMTVRVTGSRDTYSGTYEIMSGAVEILDSTVKTVTPVDYTEKFQNAESLKDVSLVSQQALLVTVKGVEITGEDVASGYFKFKLGTLESYVRISSSVCPISAEDQKTFKEAHAAHLGWKANATGVLCVYDGAFYLSPVSVDAFEYIGLPDRDDAGKVAFEKENLTFEKSLSESKELALVTSGSSYDGVVISWTSDNAAAVVSEDGTKLTVTIPDSDTTVKVTATIKSGDVTDTKEFELKLVAGEPTYEEIVASAYALEEGAALSGTYRLFGEIVSIDTAYSEQYGNITVTIAVAGLEDKPVQCFRLKGEGVADLAVGDKITVQGVIKNYKGTVEFDSGCLFIGKGEIIDQSKTVLAAYALEQGASMSSLSILKGVISTIDTEYSEQYGNITVTIIVDGMTDNPIQCYRLKGEGIATLAVGDEIAVLGTIKNYKGTIEFDSGCVLVPVADLAQVKTVLAAYKLAEGQTLGGTRTVTGVITTIDTVYSEQYGNITVTIAVNGMSDKLIQCFRLKGEGAAELAVGDTITVTGVIKNYKGTVEFDSGCTFVK